MSATMPVRFTVSFDVKPEAIQAAGPSAIAAFLAHDARQVFEAQARSWSGS